MIETQINNTIDKAGARMDDVSANIKSVSEKFNSTLAQLDPTLKNFKTLSDSLAQLRLNQTLAKAPIRASAEKIAQEKQVIMVPVRQVALTVIILLDLHWICRCR